MATIQLTKGYFAVVDDDDLAMLSGYSWYAIVGRYGVYAATTKRAGGGSLRMHRAIMQAPDGSQVDHIDHDGLNNRRGNLRICTRSQNQHNRRPDASGSSKYKGVSYDKRTGKWQAMMTGWFPPGHKQYRLGRYSTEIAAAKAYDFVAVRSHGEFAFLNFPEVGE